MSQLWHSTHQKTTPAARSAPTLPAPAGGGMGAGGGVGASRGGVGAGGGVGAAAAGLRSPTGPCGTGWSRERNEVWDSLS